MERLRQLIHEIQRPSPWQARGICLVWGTFPVVGPTGFLATRIVPHLIPSLWEDRPCFRIEAMSASRPDVIQDEERGLVAHSDGSASFGTAREPTVEGAGPRERLGGGAARRTVEERLADTAMAEHAVWVHETTSARAVSLMTPPDPIQHEAA